MISNKNLIEVLNIEEKEVAVSRQGTNNCMVNLTQMAKPYGKRPIDWLKSKEGKEYLAIAEVMNSDVRNPHITYQPIITRKGNFSEREQGTWCTDYHVAVRFAQWLDPAFAWRLDDAIIKFLTGRNVGTFVNTHRLPAPKHRDGFVKLEAALRKYTSLDNLKQVAKECKVTLGHVKDVLKGNKVSNPVLRKIIGCAKKNKEKGITYPDWRIRKSGVNYNQTMLDLFPQEVGDINSVED